MLAKLHYLYRAYRYRLRVDPDELRYVCDMLRPGQVAVDAGCHKGAYTYWMRRCVGPTGVVFSFEPQPRQVEYLRAVFAAMRYANVTLVPMGLSNAPGRLSLHIPAGAGETHSASFERGVAGVVRGSPDPAPVSTEGLRLGEAWRPAVGGVSWSGDRTQPGDRPQHELSGSVLRAPCSLLDVDVTTLDEFFASQPRGPDFIKIDVEGHELAVLEGARRTLAATRPAILVECEARHRPDGDVRPVFEFLHSLGYQGSFFLGGYRRPLAEFDPAVHQRIDPQSPHLPRGYVNNFAFEFVSQFPSCR